MFINFINGLVINNQKLMAGFIVHGYDAWETGVSLIINCHHYSWDSSLEIWHQQQVGHDPGKEIMSGPWYIFFDPDLLR